MSDLQEGMETASMHNDKLVNAIVIVCCQSCGDEEHYRPIAVVDLTVIVPVCMRQTFSFSVGYQRLSERCVMTGTKWKDLDLRGLLLWDKRKDYVLCVSRCVWPACSTRKSYIFIKTSPSISATDRPTAATLTHNLHLYVIYHRSGQQGHAFYTSRIPHE